MKIVVHGAGRVLRHDEIELVNARLFYGLYGFEIFDEIRPAPRADAVYLIKRGDIPLVSEGALILYGEAVRFLLYAADEREHIDALMNALRATLTGDSAAAIESASEALAKGTEAFAAERMNRGIRQALAGKNVQAI